MISQMREKIIEESQNRSMHFLLRRFKNEEELFFAQLHFDIFSFLKLVVR